MTMHLRTNTDLTAFLKEARNCSGEVHFSTPEGDSLNLKSTLSQFIFCSLAAEHDLLHSGIITYDISDEGRLNKYLEDDNDDK